jgi:hypothetical protein
MQFLTTGTTHTTSIGWLRDRRPVTRLLIVTCVTNPLNLDLRARAELLVYLVSSNLLAKQLTGGWLSLDHDVESSTLWLESEESPTRCYSKTNDSI